MTLVNNLNFGYLDRYQDTKFDEFRYCYLFKNMSTVSLGKSNNHITL